MSTPRPSFAEEYKSYGGQENVVPVPEPAQRIGFTPESVLGKGQPLSANHLNWLFRAIFRLFRRDTVSDASGTALFTTPDSFITLKAFDRADSNKFLVAVGYKASNAVHTLKVVQANGLALGAATIDGNQPVTGGANVVTLGESKQNGWL